MDCNFTGNISTRPLTACFMKDDKTLHSLLLTLHLFIFFNKKSDTSRQYFLCDNPRSILTSRCRCIIRAGWSQSWGIQLPLLPTHALQMPCQHLKSTIAYFSPGGKDQLVDHYDPISLPVYWRWLVAVGQISHFEFRWQIYQNLYQVLNRLHDWVNRKICFIKKTTRRLLFSPCLRYWHILPLNSLS